MGRALGKVGTASLGAGVAGAALGGLGRVGVGAAHEAQVGHGSQVGLGGDNGGHGGDGGNGGEVHLEWIFEVFGKARRGVANWKLTRARVVEV